MIVPKPPVATTPLVADRRLWLDGARQRVLEDGDGDAAFLLAGPGSEIPGEEAVRLGLYLQEGCVRQAVTRLVMEPKVEEPKVEPKATPKGQDKAKRKPEDK